MGGDDKDHEVVDEGDGCEGPRDEEPDVMLCSKVADGVCDDGDEDDHGRNGCRDASCEGNGRDEENRGAEAENGEDFLGIAFWGGGCFGAGGE